MSFLLIACFVSGSATAAVVDLKVMSYNVRVGSADQNTPNDWDLRKNLLVSVIDNYNPDIFGVQESLSYQNTYIQDNSSRNYSRLGVSVHNDGTGEYVSLFYKTNRFTKISNGNFWLSPTPDTPDTIGWDAMFERLVTWAVLQDNSNPGLKLLVMNTHWDHVGDTARLNSATLMREKIAELRGTMPIIVMGDFNADEGSDPYRRMTGRDDYPDGLGDFSDTYRQIHSDSATVGTAPGFDGTGGTGRIDWILHKGALQTIAADIDHTHNGTQYPSDHSAITSTIRPTPEPAAIATLTMVGASLLLRRSRSKTTPSEV